VTAAPLVVVGDTLLDRDLVGRVERLCPDAPVPVVDDVEERPRPGGAGLAALLAAFDGRAVTLVTALADDVAGQLLRDLLMPYLRLVVIPLPGRTPEKVRVRVDGQSLVRIDHGGPAVPTAGLPVAAREAIAEATAVLVSDYGRGMTAHPDVRRTLRGLAPRVPVVWDPHPKGAVPVSGARLATPNMREAEVFAPSLPPGVPEGTFAAVSARAAALVTAWSSATVAVTLGRRGALLSSGAESPLVMPARPVSGADPCGAGDRFAAAAAGRLADGALPSEAVGHAVLVASAFVEAGGAAGLRTGAPEAPAAAVPRTAREVVTLTRAAGGTVVATGGCFDLLHAGHVNTLRAARSLGDCLIVCLNSDDSVRRLKGVDRPLVPEPDRVAVLQALDCVDAVAVFDEDTPERLLDALRPDVWAKGGDYADVQLPESTLVASWGGQAVILPYLAGRSTTGLVEAAAAAAAGRRLPGS
jgi:D-beta-D-heptose 7-phosphate kinase / D-beta-D-heptose 1-phosphate adenosyltransferase